jgi:hypothetical protein
MPLLIPWVMGLPEGGETAGTLASFHWLFYFWCMYFEGFLPRFCSLSKNIAIPFLYSLLWDIQLHGWLLQLQMDVRKGYNATNLHITQQFLLWMGTESPITYHPSVLSSVTRGLRAGQSSEEWHIPVSPCPSKMCVVSKNLFCGYLLPRVER